MLDIPAREPRQRRHDYMIAQVVENRTDIGKGLVRRRYPALLQDEAGDGGVVNGVDPEGQRQAGNICEASNEDNGQCHERGKLGNDLRQPGPYFQKQSSWLPMATARR